MSATFDHMGALARWECTKVQLAELKTLEADLRKQLFGHFFPSPKEGTNTFLLPSNWQVKGKYGVTRDIDEGALDSLKAAKVGDMLPTLQAMMFDVSSMSAEQRVLDAVKINPDALVRRKPELSTTVYRTLTAEQRALWDTCLIIKPGSVALEIAEPAKGRGAKA